MFDSFPRGVRNCNPGNIRISDTEWEGKITPSPDKAFETFDCMKNGIRAMTKILLTYFRRYRLNTVADIITRWAPPKENNTLAYIRAVCSDTGFGVNEPLDLEDRHNLFDLVQAIIRHENGGTYIQDRDIMAGITAGFDN
jgi:hypothetical protein